MEIGMVGAIGDKVRLFGNNCHVFQNVIDKESMRKQREEALERIR